MPKESLGAVVKRLREAKSLSKTDLAAQALISDTYLVHIEKGQRTPSESVLRRLARVLGVYPYELLVPAGRYTPELVESVLEDWGAPERKSLEDPNDPRHDEAQTWFQRNLEGDWPVAVDDETGEVVFRSELHNVGPRGWFDLRTSDQQLVQQLIDRLLFVEDAE